nr:MAG TPA: Mak10 subunit, NatC N(alpha)-terminal acetyltransferase [Caudoviricetes sp.]
MAVSQKRHQVDYLPQTLFSCVYRMHIITHRVYLNLRYIPLFICFCV